MLKWDRRLICSLTERVYRLQVYLSSRTLTAWQQTLASGLLVGCLCGSLVRAQSVPQAPFDMEFAGVTVHLNETGRQRVQRELNQLYVNRDTLRRNVALLQQLTPLLEPLFEKQRLPGDYRYAAPPFDEDKTAYWGLTTEKARQLGLRVDPMVDERYHPILATETVTNRLNTLHRTSGNYVRTLLTYLHVAQPPNARTANVDSTYLMLDAENSPPLIWEILARKLAYEQEQPLSGSANQYIVYDYRQGEGQSIEAIARRLQVDGDRLKPFNRWLLTETIPTGKEYPVLVRVLVDEFPRVRNLAAQQETSSLFKPADVGFPVLTKLPVQAVSPRLSAVLYTIHDRPGIQAQSCDNVITLSYLGKVTIQSLLNYNDLTEKDLIQPGQIYYLAAKAKRAKVPFHIVQRNQTLREIAYMYGVRLKSLLNFNDIKPTQRVQAGRVIWLQRKRPRRQPIEYQQLPVEAPTVPPVEAQPILATTPTQSPRLAPADTLSNSVRTARATPALKPATKPVDAAGVRAATLTVVPAPVPRPQGEPGERYKLHVVRPGQTYFAISKLYGVSVRQLYVWNRLSERIPLEVGQTLIVNISRQPAAPKGLVTKPVTSKPTAQVPLVPTPVGTTSAPKPAGPVAYHVVQPGQTVYRVALFAVSLTARRCQRRLAHHPRRPTPCRISDLDGAFHSGVAPTAARPSNPARDRAQWPRRWD